MTIQFYQTIKEDFMFIKTIKLTTILFLLISSGCATIKPMALSEKSEKVDPASTIYLMSTSLKNNYKENHQPNLVGSHIEQPNAKDDKNL